MCAESMQGRIDRTGAGCLADTGSWLNGVGNHLYIDVWQLFCFSVINNVLNTVINNVLNIFHKECQIKVLFKRVSNLQRSSKSHFICKQVWT